MEVKPTSSNHGYHSDSLPEKHITFLPEESLNVKMKLTEIRKTDILVACQAHKLHSDQFLAGGEAFKLHSDQLLAAGKACKLHSDILSGQSLIF